MNAWKTIAVALLVLLAANAVAQQGDDLGAGRERHLGGHGFLPSMYVTDPWVGTQFRNATGGGVAVGLEQPYYDLDGNELFTLEGDVFYAALGMGYQYRLGGTWAVGGRFAANARSGTNTYSVVSEGANVDRSAHLWVKKRVMRSDTSQLTVGLDWDYTKIFLITPLEFARAIANGEDLDSADLMHDVKGWTARATVEYAHAFSPTYGVRANGAVGLYEEPLAAGVSKATHRVGAMAEADLKHKFGVPLGVTLGYTLGFPTTDPTAGLSGTLLGFWYTGRENFVVGVETGYMSLPTGDDSDDISAMYGVFTLRYYF
jgi:hypothetical protein